MSHSDVLLSLSFASLFLLNSVRNHHVTVTELLLIVILPLLGLVFFDLALCAEHTSRLPSLQMLNTNLNGPWLKVYELHGF